MTGILNDIGVDSRLHSKPLLQGIVSVIAIYRQLSCCGDENHSYGRM